MALAVVAVGVFFGLLEGSLALFGVRPSAVPEDPFLGFAAGAALFSEVTGADGSREMETAEAKRRFFNEQRFPRQKPPGTFRIFCLGGSTTYGRPYDDATSFAGWLRAMLPVADPTREWEVINAGGISYASYRISNLMEELAGYDPDLFIVYTGHNEFLEERTYSDVRRTPQVLRSAAALVSRTRTGAAMKGLIERFRRPRGQGSSRGFALPEEVEAKLDRSAGLGLYSRDDALRDDVLRHFQLSLERIVGMADESGAQLILVTPASNLRDFSPFKSQHSPELSSAEQLRSRKLLAAARAASSGSQWASALTVLDEALEFDPRHAELHYQRGRALIALGRAQEAMTAFRRARDQDVCPLRALSLMSGLISEAAADSDVMLVDFAGSVERRAEAEEGYPIPGDESFLDHVHPTIEMHRQLAESLISAMAGAGLVTLSRSWGREEIARVASEIEGQLDTQAQARALANLAMTLSWAGKDEYSVRLAQRALEAGLDDQRFSPTILAIVARHWALQGDAAEAISFYRSALRANPGNADIHMQMGMFLAGGLDLEGATAHLFLATLIWSGNDETHRQLAYLQERRQRHGEALRSLLKVKEVRPDDQRLDASIARLRTRVSDSQGSSRETSVDRYPSGSARFVFEISKRPEGDPVRDGIWTAWSPEGDLRAFAEYEDGELLGSPVWWDAEGERSIESPEEPAS